MLDIGQQNRTKPLFKDFLFFSLKEEIFKRVINDEMRGSSWRFNKFIYFNLRVLKEEFILIR